MSESAVNLGEGATWPQGARAMESNRYAVAGWLSIAQGALFPVALGLQMATGIIGAAAFKYHGPIFGPADLLFIAVTGMSIYTLMKFKQLLNERYSFHALDVWIPVAIWWGVLFQVGSIALRVLVITVWPVSEAANAIVNLSFMGFFLVTAGVIDIIIAAFLLKSRGTFSGKIDAFAYVLMAAGIIELTVILIPLVGFLLYPVSQVILALIFFEKEEVEFV